MAGNPKSAPRFNSTHCYVVIRAHHKLSVLNDAPYSSFHMFLWAGQRSESSDAMALQILMEAIEMLQDASKKNKVRLHLEYQYNESLAFL